MGLNAEPYCVAVGATQSIQVFFPGNGVMRVIIGFAESLYASTCCMRVPICVSRLFGHGSGTIVELLLLISHLTHSNSVENAGTSVLLSYKMYIFAVTDISIYLSYRFYKFVKTPEVWNVSNTFNASVALPPTPATKASAGYEMN